jgi:hypothetical protein
MWDEPAGEIDSLLVSAKKQDDLFARKGLTEKFVIHGQSQSFVARVNEPCPPKP